MTTILKALFGVLIDKVIAFFERYFARKKEQDERHAENTGNAEDYKKPDGDADDFSKLP